MRVILRLAALLVLVAAALAGVTAPAQAAEVCTVDGPAKVCCDVATKKCRTVITKPGKPGGPSQPTPPPGRPGPPTKPTPCRFGTTAVPCSSPTGTWSNAHQCYLQVEDPPPLFVKNHPGETAYRCTPPAGGASSIVWIPTNPGAPLPAPPPDPAVVAAMIVKSMRLTAPEFADTFAPRPTESNPNSVGAVGLPVWMAVAQSPRTTGPLTVTASLGGTTVTATARPTSYDWNVGGGVTHRCTSPGTVFHPGDGVVPSPDCGSRYLKVSPHTGYPVTVTAHWIVQWAGAGATGQIPLDLTSPTRHVRIGELQAVGVAR